jgi:predicted DNA-binding transcriptional regulator AlpA
MKTYSTREAARMLGLHPTTLADYIVRGKVPAPAVLKVGTASLHAWTEAEIEHVRQLLPKIANGRKTRYKKKQSAKKKSK